MSYLVDYNWLINHFLLLMQVWDDGVAHVVFPNAHYKRIKFRKQGRSVTQNTLDNELLTCKMWKLRE